LRVKPTRPDTVSPSIRFSITLRAVKHAEFDVVVVGGINSDFVLRGQSLPQPGETVVLDEFFQGPGGKGANQAVAAARLGARVAMIGCVGDDERGDELLANLRAQKVETRFVARAKKTKSGIALILVDASGEKSIGAWMGANAKLSPAHIRSAREALLHCKTLLMQFEAPDSALLAAVKLAKKAGAKVILDPAPPRKILPELLPLLDVLRPNASEAQFQTGIPVTDRASARRAAEALMKRGVNSVALQAGDGADLFVWPGGEEYLPHFKVKSIDATGAGDAFAAALAVGIAEGKNLFEAGRMGSATAAIKTTKIGAQAGLPTRRELEHFLRRHA
jgi:ribokinase